MIREATAADWPNIWPIFSEITKAGDTYAYPVDTDRSTAEMLWMTKPDRTFVLEENGEILGTYYLKTNQDGPGKHVCNCGYMVTSAARGRGLAQQMCLHSQGIAAEMGYRAMQFNFVASSMTSLSHSGKDWVSMLSGPCRGPLTIRHWDWSMPL